MEHIQKLDKQLASLGVPADSKTLGLILVALVVVFITIKLLFGKKTAKGDSILLLGDTFAGKTLLYLRLVHDTETATHASMQVGDGIHKFDHHGKPRSIRVVDLPGHQRLRGQVDELIGRAAGIIFVVDSSEFKEAPVASYLYALLTNKIINKRDIPILILLNKSDQASALPESVIKGALEKELSELRRTRQAMPKAHGTKEESEEIYLGVENKAFTFDQLPLSITFAKASVRDNEIEPVADFIADRF